MHHFRMKSFSLIPCHKKDVSNFWCCCCYHFTDSSQQNLFIWSCSLSIGKRRSTSRSFLVNFSKFYEGILVEFPTIFKKLLSKLRFWLQNLDCEFLSIMYLFFSYSQIRGQMIQDMIVFGYHPLTQEVNRNWYAFQNYKSLMWYEWDDWQNNLVPIYSKF